MLPTRVSWATRSTTEHFTVIWITNGRSKPLQSHAWAILCKYIFFLFHYFHSRSKHSFCENVPWTNANLNSREIICFLSNRYQKKTNTSVTPLGGQRLVPPCWTRVIHSSFLDHSLFETDTFFSNNLPMVLDPSILTERVLRHCGDFPYYYSDFRTLRETRLSSTSTR